MTETAGLDLFGLTDYAGIRLTEFEDEPYRYGAYGHHEPARIAAAIHAHHGARWPGAADLPVEEGIGVEHVWAVIEHEAGSPDDDGWYFTWDGITEGTPDAFPMTVVPDGPPAR